MKFLFRVTAARIRNRGPFILSHLVTGRCNCCCATCLWRDLDSPEMGTDEIKKFYADARAFGFAGIVLWGGEPLMRGDLPEILHYANGLKFLTVLITNGSVLPELLGEFKTFADVLILSVDHPDAAVHDRIRGRVGVWSKVKESIPLVRANFPETTITINSVLSKINAAEIERLAGLAADWGTRIYFSPMETDLALSAGFGERKKNLALDEKELAAACKKILLLKKSGYPVANTAKYLRRFIPRKKPFTCRYQYAVAQIEPSGMVEDCSCRDVPLGDLKCESIGAILSKSGTRRIRAASRRCNVCNNPDVIETSLFYDLSMPVILEKIKAF